MLNSRPTYTYPPAQLRAFEAKKAELRAARALILAGKFQEGIAAYNFYLARYPNSVAARNELASAQAAQEKATQAKTKVTVTAPKQTQKKEPDKKPSLLQRLFHRGSSKAPPKKP